MLVYYSCESDPIKKNNIASETKTETVHEWSVAFENATWDIWEV